MDVGKRDKTMSDMASIAAEAFCDKHTSPSVNQAHIRANPEMYLEHTVPYITVRTLHRLEETLKRQETALKSLEADSRWIKWFAIITGVLTLVLVFLTIVCEICLASGYGDAAATIKRGDALATIKRIAIAISDSNDDTMTARHAFS